LGRCLSLGSELDWLVMAAPGEEQVAALPPLIERNPPGRDHRLRAGCPHRRDSRPKLRLEVRFLGLCDHLADCIHHQPEIDPQSGES
jgi:hypothetical protein